MVGIEPRREERARRHGQQKKLGALLSQQRRFAPSGSELHHRALNLQLALELELGSKVGEDIPGHRREIELRSPVPFVASSAIV